MPELLVNINAMQVPSAPKVIWQQPRTDGKGLQRINLLILVNNE
jgi:hypothetical protein